MKRTPRKSVKRAPRREQQGATNAAELEAAGRGGRTKYPVHRRIASNGRIDPAGCAVYYRQITGDIVCVSPDGRDLAFERRLQDGIHLDRVHLTFAEDAVDLDSHRVDYRRGDIAVTPPVREVRRRLRVAKRAHRAATHRRDRHPKTCWRIARATFGDAIRFSRVRIQTPHAPRRLSASPSAVSRLAASWERAQYRRWFVTRFLRMKTASAGIWDRVLKQGVPAMGALFTSIDFVKHAVWTQPQRRYARAIGFAGDLTKYVNSREGTWYRRHILDAQCRHRDFREPPGNNPKDPYPEVYRPYTHDPAWRRRYEDWCIIRTAGFSLRRCPRCGWHFFTAQRIRPRCPGHPPVTLKYLWNLDGPLLG